MAGTSPLMNAKLADHPHILVKVNMRNWPKSQTIPDAAWIYRVPHRLLSLTLIFQDVSNRQLSMLWPCSAGSCSQWAIDVTHTGFRNYFFDQIQALVDLGYTGIYFDADMRDITTFDGNGVVYPRDPSAPTTPLTLPKLRGQYNAWMNAIKARFPNLIIAHEAIWWSGNGTLLLFTYFFP